MAMIVNPYRFKTAAPIGLEHWQQALYDQDAGLKSPRLFAMLDSETWGQYSGPGGVLTGNQKVNSWPTVLRNLLVAAGRSAQANSVITDGSQLSPNRNIDGDPRVVKGTQWGTTVANFRTAGGYMFTKVNSTPSPCTFTFQGTGFSDLAINTFRVWYPRPANGATLTFLVDGVAAGSVNTSGGASNQLPAYIDLPAGAASTNHVVSIDSLDASASSTAAILAVEGFNTAVKSVSVMNGGWCGSFTSSWLEAVNPWSPGIFLPYYEQDLTVCMGGVNDILQNVALATTIANLQSIINLARSRGGDIVLCTLVPIDPINHPSVTQAKQDALNQAIRDLCTANACPCVDVAAIFGGTYAAGDAMGYYSPTGGFAHPNAAGYAAIAYGVFLVVNFGVIPPAVKSSILWGDGTFLTYGDGTNITWSA